MVDEKALLSSRVKALRERRGWSIAETARRAGVSVSMLWKVENGQTTLTYGRLAKLAAGLEVPIGELFANPVPSMRKGGRRVVERSGSGPAVDVNSNLHRFLATDLACKHYFPCLIEVNAKGDGQDGDSHGGEEFSFVVAGRVRFHCEGYEPVELETGDSVYFDASLRHRYVCASKEAARLLCVYSHPEHARLNEAAAVEPHSLAMRAFGQGGGSRQTGRSQNGGSTRRQAKAGGPITPLGRSVRT